MERDGFEISGNEEPVPADYIGEFDDDDGLTYEQRLELLEVLFQIMKSFVQMGYGMEPVNKLIEAFENCARDSRDLIEFHDDDNEDAHE